LGARDERRSGERAAGGAVAVVALLAVVGVGAAGALRTDPDADRAAAGIAVFPLLVLLGAAAAAAVITTVLARRKLLEEMAEEDDEDAEATPGSRLLRIALFLLPFVVAGAVILAIALRPPHRTPQDQVPAQPPAARPVDAGGDRRDVWGLVAIAAGALAVTAAFGYVGRRARPHRRRKGLEPRRPPGGPDAASAVDDALAEIEAETDPRRAIINAYVRMERALDAAGFGRRAPEAPREYLGRVAGALDSDERAAHRLTALYEEARFSVHPIDEAMRAEAVAALRALRPEAAA
jgi:uncharacterized protein DUF4129